MDLTDLFIDNDRLRPIWRFFVCLVVLFLVGRLSREIFAAVVLLTQVHLSGITTMLWGGIRALIVILASFKLMTAVFDRRPLGSVGLAFHPRWWKELAHGVAVGGAMLFAAVALEWCGGFAHFTFVPHPVAWAGLSGFVLFAVAATNEEAVFRGYPFQCLVASITPLGAIAVTSAFFGAAHLGNPHRTWISTINTMLVGVPFAIAYLRTRSLWMPIGMHFIWNFLLDFIFGLPVSGLNMTASVLSARVQGPTWLTGGDYGPEGSLLATIVILLGILYLAFAKSIYTSEEMKALVSAPAVSHSPEVPITTLFTSLDEGTKID
jgi:hypothetical protein